MSDNTNLIEPTSSILSTTKQLVGVSEDDESFDLDIMLNINAAISTLYQLGVVKKAYTVTSKEDTYEDLIPDGTDDVVNQIKMYLVCKTKLGFDNSTLSTGIIEVLKEMIREAEYRLYISFNPDNTFSDKGVQ